MMVVVMVVVVVGGAAAAAAGQAPPTSLPDAGVCLDAVVHQPEAWRPSTAALRVGGAAVAASSTRAGGAFRGGATPSTCAGAADAADAADTAGAADAADAAGAQADGQALRRTRWPLAAAHHCDDDRSRRPFHHHQQHHQPGQCRRWPTRPQQWHRQRRAREGQSPQTLARSQGAQATLRRRCRHRCC